MMPLRTYIYTYQQVYSPHDEVSSRKLLRKISWNETHNEKPPEHNTNLETNQPQRKQKAKEKATSKNSVVLKCEFSVQLNQLRT